MEIEKSKVTYKEISIFVNMATGYLNANPAQNLLSAALTRVIKMLKTSNEDFEERMKLQRIKLAIKEGSNKAVLINKDNQYQYTEENLLALEQFLKDEQNKTKNIKPVWVEEKELPANLIYSWRSAFEKFVIKEVVIEEDTLPEDDPA